MLQSLVKKYSVLSMIAFLKGRIKDISDEKSTPQDLIIATGGDLTGWVGYLVKTPKNIHYSFLSLDQEIELYIYSHIREDAFDLYGFKTQSEKSIFLSLLSINGVGPKMAVGILSHASEADLVQMILEEDKERLTKIPGVGKKTAERIIIELREKIKKSNAEMSVSQRSLEQASSVFLDAQLALQALGYKEAQAKQMLDRVEQPKAYTKTEELIKAALQKGV